MAALSSWDNVAPPAAPAPAPAAAKAAPKPRAARPAAPPAARQGRADAAAGKHRAAGQLGLVPQRAEVQAPASAAGPAAARAGGGGDASAEKRKAYNPGRYVRVSNQSSYEAELFARSIKKSEALPVVLSKNKLLANEILAPQFAKISPRAVRVSKPAAAKKHAPDQSLAHKQKQGTAAASAVYGTLQDSVDDLVLKQLGLDAYGNPTRTRQTQFKSPKRASAYNESSQWKSEGHFMKAAVSTDQGLAQFVARYAAEQSVAQAHGAHAHYLGDEGASPTRKHNAHHQPPHEDQHGQRGHQHDYSQQQQNLQWTEVHAQHNEKQQRPMAGYGAAIAGVSPERAHPPVPAASWAWPPHGAAPAHGDVSSVWSSHLQGPAGGDSAQPGPRQSYPQGNHPSTIYPASHHYLPYYHPHHHPPHPHQVHGEMYPSQPAHQSHPHHPHHQHQPALPHGQYASHAVPTAAARGGGGWQYVKKEGERGGAGAEGASEHVPSAAAHESVPTVHPEAAGRLGGGATEGSGDGAERAVAGGEGQRLSRDEMAQMLAARMENSTVDFLSAGFGRPGGGAPLGTAFGGHHYGQRKWPEVPPALGFAYGSPGAPGIGGKGAGGGEGRNGGEEGPRWGRRRVDPSEWGLEGLEASPGQAAISDKERKREELRREWEEQIAAKQRRLEAEKAAQQQREAAEQRNQPDFGSIPLGAVTKDGVWLGDMGGQGLRGPSTPFRKTKDAAPVPAKNAVPDELLNKESQLQSRHVNPNAPKTSHSVRRPPMDGGEGKEDVEFAEGEEEEEEEEEEGEEEGLGDVGTGRGRMNARKGPAAAPARPKNTVPEELLNKESKLLSHHVRGPTPPASSGDVNLEAYQVPGTPVMTAHSHANNASQSQRISTGAARISTGASMQALYGAPASPPRQHSPGSRPVSIMSSPGRRVRNHRVSFQGPSGEQQSETPPLSAAGQGGGGGGGGGGKRVAFNTSEMLGHTGPQGWTSRPGSMLPDASGRDGSMPEDRRPFDTPLSPPGQGTASGLLPHAPQLAGGASPEDMPPKAIKVYRRADGSQAGARVDAGVGVGGHAAGSGRRSKDSPSPGPAANASVHRAGGLAGEGVQGGWSGVGAGGGARGPRGSFERDSAPLAKGSRDALRGGERRGGRLPETSKAAPGRRGAGNGPAQSEGARRHGAAGKRRGAPAGSEELVFDNHEPSIISASSRLIFYTGPGGGAPQTPAPAT